MIQAASSPDPVLVELLRSHPLVDWTGNGADLISFSSSDRTRSITQRRCEGLGGIVELCDNNPMVCADTFSVPSPITTLALIAVGPLLRAGLVIDEIVFQSSLSDEAPDLMCRLEEMGLDQSVSLALQEQDLGSVVALNAFVPIQLLDDWKMLDELYDESFGRSFFVRPAGDAWETSLVANRPWAVYDLRLTAGDSDGLLTVRVMADRKGKIGPCQTIHALNVMCGLEECLGIPSEIP